MSNQNIETVSSGADRFKVALAVLAIFAGIVGYYMLAQQPAVVRLASILVGLIAGVAIGWFSGPGRRLFAFAQDAWAKTKRVVWPTRKETWQMTLYVFAFVFVMALFLWMVDKALEWILYDLILGWKR